MDSAKTRKRGVTVEKARFEREAAFLLSTASAAKDFARARKNRKKLGLDPDAIPTGLKNR
jgi:hypothetical protein